MSTPVGGRGWDAEVGQKIVLMVSRQDSRAELTLTPPQLGKIEVTISMNGRPNQRHVRFGQPRRA
ncbi:MAG: hypothetical protein M5R42_03260 [Rhodocyclaceae bacterium]|nr:hypothetical protein [Rhodocyclaceae bacterium]